MPRGKKRKEREITGCVDGTDIIVVLGMHRTGTSVIVNVLHKLGVDILGRGRFWESNKIRGQETRLLKKCKGRWKAPPRYEELDKYLEEYKEIIKNVVFRERKNKVFGFKAIRSTLCPEILLSLPNLKFIISLRCPKAVNQNLLKRNKIDSHVGNELWATYYFRLLRFLSRHDIPFIIINYDYLVDNQVETIKHIASFIGIEATDRKLEMISEEVKGGQRHYTCD